MALDPITILSLLILLIGAAMCLRAPQSTVRPPRFQFGLGALFQWTAIFALWMFVVVRSLPVGLLAGYAIGFACLLAASERTRPPALAVFAMLFYMTIVPLVLIATLMRWMSNP